MRHVFISVAVLSACGGGGDGQHHTVVVDSSTADATHDAPAQSGPNAIKLEFFGTPDLIVYRDGAGPWVVPATTTGGYQLHVTDDYQVVAACSEQALAGNEDSEQLNATADDGEQFMFCGDGGSSTTTTIAVTGQMLLPGSVQMSATASGTTSPWNFSLDVSPGTHDLFAIGATKMQIRRNLALNEATTVSNVDVATDGTAYTSIPATITGAGQTDNVEIRSELFSANDYATLSDTTDRSIIYAPASLVVTSDETQVEVQVTNTAMTINRSVFAFDVTPTSFTLMPVLSGVAFGASSPVAATWGTLPTYSTLGLFSAGGTQASFVQQSVNATQAWVAKTNATSLVFESGATGYNPAWNVPTAGAFAEFSATAESQGASASTGVTTGGGAAVANRISSDRRRVRQTRSRR